MESILVVEVYYIEDDENIAQAVKEYLYEKNCIVSVFATITDAKKAGYDPGGGNCRLSF